jgi:hypothetical protein
MLDLPNTGIGTTSNVSAFFLPFTPFHFLHIQKSQTLKKVGPTFRIL